MREPRTIRVEVGDLEGSGPLSELTDLIAELVEGVPEQYRDALQYEIEVEPDYDGYILNAEIFYCREETQEELQAEADRDEARLRSQERAEREALVKLAKKYNVTVTPNPITTGE